MTREEEIKARLEKAQVDASSYHVIAMDIDIAYLLARNEELQRRVEKMKRVVELAKRIYTENEAKEIIGLGIDLLNALNAVDADLPVPEEVEVKAEVENG